MKNDYNIADFPIIFIGMPDLGHDMVFLHFKWTNLLHKPCKI